MEQSSEGDEDDYSEGADGDEDVDEKSRAGKRRSGTTKLPGLAQLDGEVQAIAERERSCLSAATMMGVKHEGRRGSGGSSGSHGSDYSRSGGSG